MKLTTVTKGSDTRLDLRLDPRPLTRVEVMALRDALDEWVANVAPDPDCWRCGDLGRLADHRCECDSDVFVGPTLPAEPAEEP